MGKVLVVTINEPLSLCDLLDASSYTLGSSLPMEMAFDGRLAA